MTLNATPLWLQGSSGHTADMYRRWLDWQTNLKSGIFSSGDFAVSQHGTPNMSVDVAPGMALVRGTEDATYQGMYLVDGQSVQTVTITAAHATLNRIDLLGIRIRDNAYSTGPNNDATIISVDGTPASSPVAPSAPPNFFILATVAVNAAVTSVVTANITNVRTTTAGQGYAGLRGAFRRTPSASRPTTNLQAYQDVIIEDNTSRAYIYDGSTWQCLGYIGGTGIWNDVSSGIGFQNSWVNYDTNQTQAAYRRIGDNVEIRGFVKNGTATAAIFTLPTGYRPTKNHVFSIDKDTAAHGRLDVLSDGTVKQPVGVTNAYVSLDGIRFSVS